MIKNQQSLYSNHAIRGYCLILGLLAIGLSFSSNSQERRRGTGGEVHGFVIANVSGQEKKSQGKIFLPDITVYLKDVSTSALSPKVPTDLKGWFAIPKMPAGTYQLCYEADGYVSGCLKENLVISSLTVFPSPIEISPKPNFIVGRVTQRDNRPGLYRDAAFGIDVQTQVRLLDSSNNAVAKPVRANIGGAFLIPNIPSGDFRISAVCEAATVERAVSLAELRRVANAGESLQLVLPNSSPRIKSVVATSNGKFVRQVAPGTTVQIRVTAEDADKDALHYMWHPSQQDRGFDFRDSPTVRWTLPKSSGLHSMFVLVKDSKGGYTLGKVDISTSGPQVLFSGRVSANDAPAIQGAAVSINGKSTTTNGQGYFFIQLPKESTRYVFNVSKAGYALYSKILFAGAIEQRISLVRAQTTTIDPDKPITVTENLRQNERSGATVEIPPKALVNPRGKRASGPLSLSLSTIDLRDPMGRLPGDFGAMSASGRNANLISYGAADIQVKDSAGDPYNLAPGKTATIRIPVDRAQLAKGAPPTIALWFYDTKAGLWRQEGKAKLVGNAYEGKVKHFSVVNVDVAYTDAACMRIHVDTTTLSLPLNLRITIPTATGLDQVFTSTITDAESVIVRLPPNEPITLEVLDTAGNPIELTKQTVDSGPAIPGLANINPPPPYPDCLSDAYLSIAPPDGGFLDYYGLDNATTADAYYAAIDESGVDRTTLASWKAVNGFGSGDDASGVYFNNGDLGFGRGMHMKKSGANIAYYVSNYPNVEAARLGINLIATVAMEYSPGPLGVGNGPYTKFYVFNNAGNRINNADLDGRGPKFIPRLCIICHAGNYVTPDALNQGNMGSRFIAFDLESFLYSGFDSSFNRANQEAQFKLLNRGVLENTNVSPASLKMIEGWYGGSGVPNGTADDNWFPNDDGTDPPGWPAPGSPDGGGDLYKFVVKTSCRTCHINRDDPISWRRYTAPGCPPFDPSCGFVQYGWSIEPFVCGSGGPSRIMPHAKQPYIRFWASGNPHRPTVLRNGGVFPAGNPCPVP